MGYLQLSPIRILHVYKSKGRAWTRCGIRTSMLKGEELIMAKHAKDTWFWRPESQSWDMVICVHCATHRDIRALMPSMN